MWLAWLLSQHNSAEIILWHSSLCRHHWKLEQSHVVVLKGHLRLVSLDKNKLPSQRDISQIKNDLPFITLLHSKQRLVLELNVIVHAGCFGRAPRTKCMPNTVLTYLVQIIRTTLGLPTWQTVLTASCWILQNWLCIAIRHCVCTFCLSFQTL